MYHVEDSFLYTKSKYSAILIVLIKFYSKINNNNNSSCSSDYILMMKLAAKNAFKISIKIKYK